MEFIEFAIFMIGCTLSHIAGIFLYAFVTGIINGILLLREAKNSNNQNVNKIENIEDTLKDTDEINESQTDSNTSENKKF